MDRLAFLVVQLRAEQKHRAIMERYMQKMMPQQQPAEMPPAEMPMVQNEQIPQNPQIEPR